MDLDSFKSHSKADQLENQKFYSKLRNKPVRNLDSLIHEQHQKVFEKTDCLACANCCKTTSPVFYERDIDRAAKAMRIKPGKFIETYLKIDEEGDYVLTTAPCPFLGSDNYCSIYNDRPTACREYPHTNRKNMHQILTLTYRNTLVCPAVLEITNNIKNQLKQAR